VARKTKPARIQERTGLSDADMQKVLYISRVTWWRWSTGKTPWAKIDPLRRDILDALWLVGPLMLDDLDDRGSLWQTLRAAVEKNWLYGNGIDR